MRETLVAFIIFLITSTAFSQEKKWEEVTPMPTARYGMCSVVYQNKIWVIGGQDNDGLTLDIVECYLPLEDRWDKNIPSLNTPRFAAAAVVYHDTIFVIGGINENGMAINSVEYFDVSSNKWKFSKGKLQQSRGALTAAVLKDTMYAIGGTSGLGPLDNRFSSVEFWDPESKKWQLSDTWLLDLPRLLMQTVVINDTAYTMGGRFIDPLNRLEIYPPPAEAEVTSMQYPRFSFAAVAVEDTIFIIGGLNSGGLIAIGEKYNIRTNEWQIMEPILSFPRLGLTAEVYDNNIYIFGGFNFSTTFDIVEKLQVGPSLTSVTKLESEQPRSFSLQQNYPNPFNAQTTITFSLQHQYNQNIELRIFDISGRLVKKYHWQSLPAGEHQVHWDGTNDKGNNVTSGIYFYKLSVVNSYKKMMLLR